MPRAIAFFKISTPVVTKLSLDLKYFESDFNSIVFYNINNNVMGLLLTTELEVEQFFQALHFYTILEQMISMFAHHICLSRTGKIFLGEFCKKIKLKKAILLL